MCRAPYRPRTWARYPAWADLAQDARRLTLLQGSHGPLQAECSALLGRASRRRRLGPAVWLLLRPHPGPRQLKASLHHDPFGPSPSGRPIEACFQEGRQNLRLGDCESRSWQGWHRHMTLCFLAHFFLALAGGAQESARPDRAPDRGSAQALAAPAANRHRRGTQAAGLSPGAQRGGNPP